VRTGLGRHSPVSLSLIGSIVRGNVTLADNVGLVFEINTATIRGSVTLARNTSSWSNVGRGNVIEGKLDCFSKMWAPLARSMMVERTAICRTRRSPPGGEAS